MLSAYSTLGIVIAHYLVNHEKAQNPVDEAFIKFVMPKLWIHHTTHHYSKWNKALEAAVITFSDTQVFTGITILLCGYIQLPSGISAYHWQVVVALAWFSSLTHLLTLTSLRGYLRKRFKMAVWRATFMGFVMILLAAALGPTGFINQHKTAANAAPAICLLSSRQRLEADPSGDTLGIFNSPFIALYIIFLVAKYIIKVFRLFKTVHEPSQERLKLKTEKVGLLERRFRSATIRKQNSKFIPITMFWDMVRALVLGIYVLSKAFYEIGNSELLEVRILKENQCNSSNLKVLVKLFWMSIALAWGSLRLIGLRIVTKLQEERKWGFGQIFPILLSFLPLWSVYEQLSGRLLSSLVIILYLTIILKKEDMKSN